MRSYRGKRRHEVGEIDQIAKSLHRHTPWLIDDERHTYASLVELCLSATEAGIAVELWQWRLHCGTVVAGKDDKGVLLQSALLKMLQQSAHGSVHVFNECRIALSILLGFSRSERGVDVVPAPCVLIDDIRLVGSVEGKIEEEGLVCLLLTVDEGNGIVGRDVGVMTHMTVVAILLNVYELVAVETIVWVIIW